MRSINHRSALFRANVETGEELQLTDYTNDLDPDWSPDGERILFTTSRDGFQELYTMSPDGSNLQRLTVNEGLNDLQGVYSPDGSMIAYSTNYSVGDASGEIWVMNADGSSQRRLTNNDRYDDQPVWSPDGTRLAFTSKRLDSFARDIFVYDLEDGSLHQLTDAPDSFIWPRWSPDAGWIIYEFNDDNNVESGTYIMRADGSDARELLPDHVFSVGNDLIWLP
jgi:Tol biopolymer transport system component